MGTRSVTTVVEGEGESETILVSLYAQFDGYPDGVGKDIAELLLGAVVGNGISYGESRNFFNGMGDLAIRLVSTLKGDPTEIGGHYLIAPSTSPDQEYNYVIRGTNDFSLGHDNESGVTISVSVWGGKVLFNGTPEDYLVWVSQEDEEED